ncbi:hypothetical protein BHM03_00042757 [Ensete ventricosum]|nr:hypothetical protein BHM03_00042757 [Ensete ventricosum]
MAGVKTVAARSSTTLSFFFVFFFIFFTSVGRADRVKQTIAPQGLNALCVPAVLVAHETAITADPCLGLQGANKN